MPKCTGWAIFYRTGRSFLGTAATRAGGVGTAAGLLDLAALHGVGRLPVLLHPAVLLRRRPLLA
ncbi:MAG: hypothetical protein AVDCRST_MAG26-3126, partial [uncultured Chloroflexia bacterium]